MQQSTEALPPLIQQRFLSYKQRFPLEITAAIGARWTEWSRQALATASAARARPKELFAEPAAMPERMRLAERHLRGDGLEIGALHNPLPVLGSAHVRYLDLANPELLALLYPEIAHYQFVHVDVVDDGERLARVADGSQDFVISNHFLEHCQDPVEALCNQARVLKLGGILYCAVPDCRKTFDGVRERTTFEHTWLDHVEGPTISRRQHYQDWSQLVNGKVGAEHEAWWRLLDALDYSIHFHVWAPWDVLALVAELRSRIGLPLDVLEFVVHANECVLVMSREASSSAWAERVAMVSALDPAPALPRSG